MIKEIIRSIHKNIPVFRVLFFVIVQMMSAFFHLPAQNTPDMLNELPGADLEISELEFINQPVAEIIISLAQLGKLSLLPDQGIAGRRSYYFRNITLKEALFHILEDNKLYLSPSGPIWIISPISIETVENGSLNLEADDVRISDILAALNRHSYIPVRFSSLPSETTSLHIKNTTVSDIVKILLLPYPEYRIIDKETYLNIVHSRNPNLSLLGSSAEISTNEEGLSVYGKNLSATDLLRDLFGTVEKDILMFTQSNPIIQEIRLSNRSFEEILQLISSITGLYYREHLNVFSFFQSATVQAYQTILEYSALHQSPKKLLELLPEEPSGNCNIRPLENSPTMLILGNSDDCGKIIHILQQLDRERTSTIWPFSTNYINSSDLFALLPSKFTHRIQQSETNPGQYYAFMNAEEFGELEFILSQIDQPQKIITHTLRHLEARDIAKHLPAHFPSWKIQASSDPRTLYISGSEELYEQFRSFIDPIDQPPQQIQYHVLIIQYQKSQDSNYSADLDVSILNAQSTEGISSNLSDVLTLNFDIISAFGYGFASDLSFDISSSKARIVADTLLRSESGKTVHFENASTYRYREIDVESKTGVTREITTGLFIDIDGKADSEGIVSMDISLNLSKQGIDISSRGNPPSSSKRRVETSVKTRTARPVRIAGVVLWEDSNYSNGIFPLGSTGENREISEFVVYILPFSMPVHEKQVTLPIREKMLSELIRSKYQ